MEIDLLFAGVLVSDFGAAVAWYERLLGRPADVVAHAEEVMWRITDSGWLYVLRDEARAGHTVVSVAVTDLDAAVAAIERRGIESAPIERIGDAGRKATFIDPDGNRIAFIQVE